MRIHDIKAFILSQLLMLTNLPQKTFEATKTWLASVQYR
uniref:Uncharacterized protein n=1 Tax=Arundo donax TaxID=35708 RepID=A0A0A9B2J0_ARUDO